MLPWEASRKGGGNLRYSNVLELSATDLSNHLGCPHLTFLNLEAAAGRIKLPVWKDAALEILKQRGFDHERAYVEHLRKQGLAIVELPEADLSPRAAERTRSALITGADVIVQATFRSDRWAGRADILRRIEVPSALGNWSYEIVDTKLARETRGGTILQLCLYSELLGEMQGRLPESMHVVTPGTGYVPEQYRLLDYFSFYRRIRRRLESEVADRDAKPATYPTPCAQCDICRWRGLCERRRRDDDHLCLVAGITKLQTGELRDRSVDTLEALGELPLVPFPLAVDRS